MDKVTEDKDTGKVMVMVLVKVKVIKRDMAREINMVSKIKFTYKLDIMKGSVDNQTNKTIMTFHYIYSNRNSKFVLKLNKHDLVLPKPKTTEIQQP